MESRPDQQDSAVSGRFRREFDATGLKSDESLVILVCAGDGAVVSVNGHEVGRTHMPPGPVDAKELAQVIEGEKAKGLVVRFRVPPGIVHPDTKNVVEADVHSASASGTRLTCDLAIKTLPVAYPLPPPGLEAKKVLEVFRKDNYIGPDTQIPDGYIDGGRHMALDAQDHATSGREILLVDRPHDPELKRDLEYARSLSSLTPMERARRLSLYIDEISTPPGGRELLGETITNLEREFANEPLRIGDVIEQCHAGVCRHRSLLFKLLADEAGLQSALVRGNYVHLHAGGADPHAWNELRLDDGRRFLVDATLHPNSEFPEITSPQVTPLEVAKRYVKVDKTPYYESEKR
jgi:hypothetical protein